MLSFLLFTGCESDNSDVRYENQNNEIKSNNYLTEKPSDENKPDSSTSEKTSDNKTADNTNIQNEPAANEKPVIFDIPEIKTPIDGRWICDDGTEDYIVISRGRYYFWHNYCGDSTSDYYTKTIIPNSDICIYELAYDEKFEIADNSSELTLLKSYLNPGKNYILDQSYSPEATGPNDFIGDWSRSRYRLTISKYERGFLVSSNGSNGAASSGQCYYLCYYDPYSNSLICNGNGISIEYDNNKVKTYERENVKFFIRYGLLIEDHEDNHFAQVLQKK